MLSIAHLHMQETQLKIKTLLKGAFNNVSLGKSSESEDENAPGMCWNNYILYVCTYVATYVCVYQITIFYWIYL